MRTRGPRTEPARDKRCAGLLSRLAFSHLQAKKVDPVPLAEQAGLDPDAIQNASASISIASQIRFLKLAAEVLGDPLIGFRLACAFDVRQLGWLYYVATSASNLGIALSRLARYCRINNEGIRLDVERREQVFVKLTYSGVPRHADFYQMGAFIGVIIILARHVTAAPLLPITIRIAHPLGKARQELARMLRCSVVDSAGIDEIQFPPTAWDEDIAKSDAFLHRLCVDACEQALARSGHGQRNLQIAVENLIAESLPNGRVHASAIAETLGMSPRTLVRRLASQGCSFSEVVSKVRLALARQYLTSSGLSVSETAWLLGYAEVSTFTKAYRRWTGSPPSASRARRDVAKKA